jgi:hypothetical protein
MSETFNVGIVSDRHGNGNVCFFDEPFGDQTPFEWAGGYLVLFDSGISDGGPIAPEDLSLGLEGWLAKRGWKRQAEALTPTR